MRGAVEKRRGSVTEELRTTEAPEENFRRSSSFARAAQTAMREMARLRLRRLPFVGAMEVGATVAPEGRMAAALRGDGVGSAADFSASGTDGGGGNGPHGRDGGRVALPSGPWASV